MAQINLKQIILCVIATVLFAVGVHPVPARAQSINRYAIGDTKDWGFPAPYFHYPRGPGYLRMSMVFDTLIWKNDKGFVPMLAARWKYNPAALEYTFELNPRARWHDGVPVTASDVAFTLSYMKKHPYAWIDPSLVDTVKAVSNHLVVIRLKHPYAPFLEDVAGSMPILPKHIWEHTTPRDIPRAKAAIGSGPYRLKRYDAKEGAYFFVRNDTYYRGRPRVKNLLFLKVNDVVLSLFRGDIQAAGIPPEAAPVLKAKGYTIMTSPSYWVLKLLINHRKSPMNDVRFRKALLLAIHRKHLVTVALHGCGTVASLGILPPESPWFNKSLPLVVANPKEARGLLEKIHPTERGTLRSLTLLTSGRFSRVAELIRQDLHAVGIRIRIQAMDETAIDAMIQKGAFDLALSGHGGIGGDPKILNDVIAGNFLLSERFTENPRLLALLKKNIETTDVEERRRIVNEIQFIHATALPSIPLYYPKMVVAHNGQIPWFYTRGGISKGIPFPFNKDALIGRAP